ncbi:MAG: hypothetical protein DME33_04415 [Verrucomicrobia bacterium]|nr:MAG: hypothetical protein DME33_04415 [Verrucomicrobiota bacterium]
MARSLFFSGNAPIFLERPLYAWSFALSDAGIFAYRSSWIADRQGALFVDQNNPAHLRPGRISLRSFSLLSG